tara:strand:- start:302 stop:517 length:216 start_codon:yes stop_codon:yes gene_type:complete
MTGPLAHLVAYLLLAYGASSAQPAPVVVAAAPAPYVSERAKQDEKRAQRYRQGLARLQVLQAQVAEARATP